MHSRLFPEKYQPVTLIDNILHQFDEWAREINTRNEAHDIILPGNKYYCRITYNQTVVDISKRIYQGTKDFLEKYNSMLTSKEKGDIFSAYVTLWQSNGCFLHIGETAYKDEYEQSRFGKHDVHYNENIPMLAGFNLSGMTLAHTKKIMCDLIFPSVNFKNADFSNVCFAYGHFESCDLSGVTTNHDSNLNQCRFKKCDLSYADLSQAEFCEVKFKESDLNHTVLNERYDTQFINCLNFNSPHNLKI